MPDCKFIQIGDYRICQNCDQQSLKRKPDAPRTRRMCSQNKLVHKRFFYSVSRIIRFLFSVYKLSTDCFRKTAWTIRLARYKLCVRCKYFGKQKPKYRQCKICACNLKLKVSWRQEECPAKYWLKVGSKNQPESYAVTKAK